MEAHASLYAALESLKPEIDISLSKMGIESAVQQLETGDLEAAALAHIIQQGFD